jgi:nicotinamidase-related amidase
VKTYVTDPLKPLLAPLEEVKLRGNNSALLIVDMQYLDAYPDHGLVIAAKAKGIDTSYYEERLKAITANIQSLLAECRDKRLEVIYCTIESLTHDGRDRSLEHKCAKLHAAPNSQDGAIIEEIKPLPDEIVLKKTCSGVFNGTNIDQILRNLKVENLVVVGVVTNQCVDTAVRDAADRGYSVVLVENACAAFHESLHQASIEILSGVYCRVKSTVEVIDNIRNQTIIKN